MNCFRTGLKSLSWPLTNGRSNMPPAMPKYFHHSWRAFSRPSGRNSSTRKPARRKASAATCTASRVSAVTGVRPSSSKYPMRCSLTVCGSGQCNGTGAADGSPSSGPCMAANNNLRSATVRAMGPTTPVNANGPTELGKCPVAGIRPGVGFSPQIPVKCAGSRMEPPPSLPTPPAEHPEEMAADSPPLDPPAVREKSHGLFVRP